MTFVRRLALSAAFVAVSRPLAGDLKLLTTPQELAIGQVFAEQVEQRYPLLHDPVLIWYLNPRGRQFADRSPRKNLPYFFRVIDGRFLTWQID